MTTVTAIDGEALAHDLKGRVRGPLLTPGDPAYDAARSVWNGMIDRRPAVIARCLGVADVIACVEVARARGADLCIKGGGHNIAGLAVRDGGLLLDMSLMRGVWVDPGQRLARAQAGCLLGDVDRETQLHGLAAVLGFVSTTGCEYTLHPVGPEIVGGAIAWRGEDAEAVLDMYRALAAEAPRELTCVAALRLAPPAPWLAKEVHGKPIVALFVCHSGPVDEAMAFVGRIKSFGRPVGDVLQRRSYVSQQMLLDATQPNGRRYYWKSEYLRGLEPELFAGAITHARRIVSPHSAILIFPLDGALNERPGDDSAVGNRDARAVINIAGAWDHADHDAENTAWARTAWSDLRRFSTGGTYINFLTEDEGDDRTRAAFRANYGRLASVKATWDPENLFRANKNIAPPIS